MYFEALFNHMNKLFKIFCWGMMISFLGSLPLGTLNVAAMQLGIQESIQSAMLFSFGSLLVEMVYVRVSLIGIDWIRKQEKLMRIMEWITLAIVLALAVGSFYAALSSGGAAKNPILNNNMNRFLLGAIGCAVNPVVIVFWFGWSTVLFTKKILLPQNAHYNSYIVGIGLGTLAGNCVFIFGGKFIYGKIQDASHYIHWFIGGIFTLTALIQIIKMARHKDAVHQFTHPEEVVEEKTFPDKDL
jgi:threonine/homoserine/homoserine lactone efflux protein